MPDHDVQESSFAGLDAATLYAILRLRADVFVVEQECAFADPDGRDLEPTTRHVWIARDGAVVAYLRVLREPDGTRKIGRVVTAPSARGEGLGDRVMAVALELVGDEPVVLDAQSRLAAWYGRLGFVRSGDDFWEDGILHTPMRRG